MLLEIDQKFDEDLLYEVAYMFGGRGYQEQADKDQINKRFMEIINRRQSIKDKI